MSIILMADVGGRLSILLMKMVVITSMVVRFTLKAASKKKGLTKVVAKVITVRRREVDHLACHLPLHQNNHALISLAHSHQMFVL